MYKVKILFFNYYNFLDFRINNSTNIFPVSISLCYYFNMGC